MNPKLLDKMADIINSKSKVFYAVVPRMKLQYMNVDGTLCEDLLLCAKHRSLETAAK
jgi:hypothetical protein